MKQLLAIAVVGLLGLFSLTCEKRESQIPTSTATKPDASQSKNDTGITLQKGKVEPDRYLGCPGGRYSIWEYYWVDQNQYQPVSGKYIGVWDGDGSRQATYVSQYGCVLAVGDIYAIDTYISAGVSPANRYVALANIGWADDVETALNKQVTRFYIDEPIHKSRQQVVRDAAAYIGSRGTLTISECYDNPPYVGSWR